MSSEHLPVVEGDAVVKGPSTAHGVRRDFRFWLVFLAIGISTVITALELVSRSLFLCRRPIQTPSKSAVSTALPSIVSDLQGSAFVWVGSAYALSATAFIPMGGGWLRYVVRRHCVASLTLSEDLRPKNCYALFPPDNGRWQHSLWRSNEHELFDCWTK